MDYVDGWIIRSPNGLTCARVRSPSPHPLPPCSLNSAFANAKAASGQEPQAAVPAGLLPVSEEDRLAAAEEKLEQLLILANDAEANGDTATALLRHEDRVSVAAKALGPSTDGPNAVNPHEKKVS